MNPHGILVKTVKGKEEIEHRYQSLEAKLRSIIIMIDGTTSLKELVDRFSHARDISSDLEFLLQHGFITGEDDYEDKIRILSRILSDMMGPHADMLNVKLEGCDSTEALQTFLDDNRDLINNMLGSRANNFWEKT